MTRDEAEKVLRDTRESVRSRTQNLGVRRGKSTLELMDAISYMCHVLDSPAANEAARVLARTPLMELTEETFREEPCAKTTT